MNFEKAFTLLSKCCGENYTFEQSNNYVHTYSCVDGVTHCLCRKSFRTCGRTI